MSNNKDVEMADASKAKEAEKDVPVDAADKEKMPIKVIDPAVIKFNEVKAVVSLIERSVATKETRFMSRALRQNSALRKKINAEDITRALNYFTFPTDAQDIKDFLLEFVKGVAMEVDEGQRTTPLVTSLPLSKVVIPEVQVYLHLVVTIHLIDQKRIDEAVRCSTRLVERINVIGKARRTMDLLSAHAFFYYSRAYELAHRLSEIRTTLLQAHRTATLTHDDTRQATLVNLLLRNYLAYNLYDQADKLVSKSTFPDNPSNNQYARYLFYLGRIKAVQLDYSEAFRCLQQAIRKAPHTTALPFTAAVNKHSCIVQLLMGDLPDRTLFDQPRLGRSLAPYYQLTQAVRVGDLAAFKAVMDKYAAVFRGDNTLSLIVRLRHNVIKTGLRKINASYSRIALSDVAAKLHLDSPDDCEGLVAKAIRDAVIDATIVHDGVHPPYLQSKAFRDVYSTHEPTTAFHKRITFCLNVHNDAVKAMSFPEDAHKDVLESAQTRRERQREQHELANNLADDDDDEL